MKKTARHNKIIELISSNEIETQSELAERLNEEGFKATQATVSRDIKELRLEKRSNGGKSCYYFPENKIISQNKYLRVLADGFERAEPAGNIVVIKTASGMAMAVAAALDALNIDEIVGTIAGDDTIMCATRSEDDSMRMVKKIRKLVRDF